jgi:hypothetical protein
MTRPETLSRDVAIETAIAAKQPSDPEFNAGAARLESMAPGEGAGLAGRTAVMFLTPACLIAGRQRLALDFTSAYGFEPILIRYVELSSAQVAAIWRYQIPGFDPLRWQVALRLFTAGPGLLVVMRQKAPRAPSAARHLKALKGPSDPAQCQAYHLRTRLGAMNKINNLVHSPDDPWDVVRELEIFLPAGEFRGTALRARGAGRSGTQFGRVLRARGAAPRPPHRGDAAGPG